MDFNINKNIIFEALLRLILWLLFLYYDGAEPFLRQIKNEELWKYQYPVSPSIFPAKHLWLTITLIPLIIFCTEFYITNTLDDPISAAFALSLAYSLNGFLTSIVKNMIGRPRPDFYYRCFPQGDGNDFSRCSGVKKNWMDGRKSFPSGHSSFAFSCMFFLSLYLARKFQLFENGLRAQSWQFCACILPLLAAAGIAISRTCDYHHHYEDVIAGSILGSGIAYGTFKLYFPPLTMT